MTMTILVHDDWGRGNVESTLDIMLTGKYKPFVMQWIIDRLEAGDEPSIEADLPDNFPDPDDFTDNRGCELYCSGLIDWAKKNISEIVE